MHLHFVKSIGIGLYCPRMKRLFVAAMLAVFLIPHASFAQEMGSRPLRAIVERVTRTYEDERGFPQLEIDVLGEDGVSYHLDTATSAGTGIHYGLGTGDRVLLEIVSNPDGTETAYYNDAIRTRGILWIALAFAALTVAVGLVRGIRALAGLAVTLAILFGVVLPSIVAGKDAVTVTVLASLVILGVNMHLTHGWRRETATAFASSAAGLALAWVFGKLFVSMAFLSGLTSDESAILYIEHLGTSVDMSGILLAGILLGAVGALDDVAIAQGEVVAELRDANPSLGRKELFIRSIRVGRHHIASIANTLVLAYAGAALPTFLLFWATESVGFSGFLNTEAIAEEIVRTLAGTAALILTVPIATWFAVSLDRRE